MGRPKGSKNGMRKDDNPFAALPQDWRDEVDALGNDEKAVRDLIAKTTLDNAALKEAEEGDEDLKEKKLAVKSAMESYSPHYKAHKLMVKYLRAHLDSTGKATGNVDADSMVEAVEAAREFVQECADSGYTVSIKTT